MYDGKERSDLEDDKGGTIRVWDSMAPSARRDFLDKLVSPFSSFFSHVKKELGDRSIEELYVLEAKKLPSGFFTALVWAYDAEAGKFCMTEFEKSCCVFWERCNIPRVLH